MPHGGKSWRHVAINSHGSWLHGDERGFRDRDHRLHSSGDYKHRPPKGEHEGLRRYYQKRAAKAVHIAKELRGIVGGALRDALKEQAYRVLAISVSGDHAHILVELPDDMRAIKAIIGECKRKASRAVKQWLPGSIWSAGGTFKRIRDRQHQISTYRYILTKQGPAAWTWSFLEKSQES